MKKIALLLALLMIIGCFAACGGDGEKNEETAPAAVGDATGQQQKPDASSGEEEEVCPNSDDGKHHYTEELAGEPTCTQPGLMLYTCNDCEFSISKDIPALGHQGTGASCEEPSICTVCGEVAEDAWGHEPESGICKYCGEFVIETEGTKATETAAEATQEATEAETV